MGVLGNLDQYTKFQSAEAIRDAAQNPGGMAGMGVGFGAGAALGHQMANAMAPTASPGAAPPPLPGASIYHVAVNGAQMGQLDLNAIGSGVSGGRIPRGALVWKAGMASWAAIETVP